MRSPRPPRSLSNARLSRALISAVVERRRSSRGRPAITEPVWIHRARSLDATCAAWSRPRSIRPPSGTKIAMATPRWQKQLGVCCTLPNMRVPPAPLPTYTRVEIDTRAARGLSKWRRAIAADNNGATDDDGDDDNDGRRGTAQCAALTSRSTRIHNQLFRTQRQLRRKSRFLVGNRSFDLALGCLQSNISRRHTWLYVRTLGPSPTLIRRLRRPLRSCAFRAIRAFGHLGKRIIYLQLRSAARRPPEPWWAARELLPKSKKPWEQVPPCHLRRLARWGTGAVR